MTDRFIRTTQTGYVKNPDDYVIPKTLICNNCGRHMLIVDRPSSIPVEVQQHINESVPETMVFWGCVCGRLRLTSLGTPRLVIYD